LLVQREVTKRKHVQAEHPSEDLHKNVANG